METSSTPAPRPGTLRPNVPSTSLALQQKQDSDVVASSHMESIVAVTGHKSTAVKGQMSDTHDEQSKITDKEIVQTPSTEPHTTLIDAGFTKNVTSKPAQDTLMKKISLLQQRINVLTEARDTGIAILQHNLELALDSPL
ncbi:PREDICTED: uncharacterized protein LOC108967094 [Bactrocera latifrons]|uniref:uncharacterized protein LOC108967094 n=1 Tax=Bactrocera latifrons TaxID=174628 RepID=UPI0008DCD947|nr:PREDICTED: uncharacterized protein LOC108967094 [Bactrocera latifrons]